MLEIELAAIELVEWDRKRNGNGSQYDSSGDWIDEVETTAEAEDRENETKKVKEREAKKEGKDEEKTKDEEKQEEEGEKGKASEDKAQLEPELHEPLNRQRIDEQLKEDGIEMEIVGGFKRRKEPRVVRKAGMYMRKMQE